MTVPTTRDTPGASARWVRRPHPVAEPRTRLVCLPAAGGTASAYYTWAARLPERVELLSVQYPGHQDRFAEPCLPSVPELADALTAALAPYADRPLHLFGHSLGAMVAYEVAVRLEAGAGPGPVSVFVSGAYAPQRAVPYPEELTDAELEEDIRAFSWLEPEVLDVPALRELVLPSLMNDIRAAMIYRPTEVVRLRCPVFSYGGSEDRTGSPEELSAWRDVSSGTAAWRQFDGDHFYLRAHEAELVADIAARMSDCSQETVGHG